METTRKEPLIDSLVIEAAIISPLSVIVGKLESKEYRDSDIGWLNDKLDEYAGLALKVIGKKVNLPGNAVTAEGRINEFVNDRFLKYFRTLLGFFKEYK